MGFGATPRDERLKHGNVRRGRGRYRHCDVRRTIGVRLEVLVLIRSFSPITNQPGPTAWLARVIPRRLNPPETGRCPLGQVRSTGRIGRARRRPCWNDCERLNACGQVGPPSVRAPLLVPRDPIALQRPFAPGLMSTVWIVPFLICFDVTTMSPPCRLRPPLAATTAAISALFKVRSFPRSRHLASVDATNRNDAPSAVESMSQMDSDPLVCTPD